MGGIYDLSVEIDPQVLANTGGVDAGSQIALNANFIAGTVASIGGATGSTITIASGGGSGWTIAPVGSPGVLTLSITVSSAATARTSLGLGGLAVLNAGAAVANSTVVAAAGYVQADFQSVIDKLNALLNSLRTAGIIAT